MVPTVAAQPATPPQADSGGFATRVRVAIVVLILGVFLYNHWHPTWPTSWHMADFVPKASASSSFQVPPEWGPALKLEKISSLTAPPDTRDFYVRANGDIVLLTGDGALDYYVAGNLSKTAQLGMGPSRSLTSDDKSIFVVDTNDAVVARYGMDLQPLNTFKIKGENSLMGVTWSPVGNVLIFSQVLGKCYYVTSLDGKSQKKYRLDTSKATTQPFMYDVAVAQGRVAFTDTSNDYIILTSVGGEQKLINGLCGSYQGRRLAIINGNFYVPCDEGPMEVLSSDLKHKGYLKTENAHFARAGKDGFLYLLADGDILKYKPL